MSPMADMIPGAIYDSERKGMLPSMAAAAQSSPAITPTFAETTLAQKFRQVEDYIMRSVYRERACMMHLHILLSILKKPCYSYIPPYNTLEQKDVTFLIDQACNQFLLISSEALLPLSL